VIAPPTLRKLLWIIMATLVPTVSDRPLTPPPSFARRVGTYLYNHPNLSLGLLLLLPMTWLLVVYLGSIGGLLVQSFYSIDDFSGVVIREFTLRTYRDLFTATHLDVFVRTLTMAAAVSLTCAIIAFPLAYYMARYASSRTRGLLYLAVMLPLWSSYLVRVYAWKLILANEGIVNWFFTTLGLKWLLNGILALPVIGGESLSFSFLGMFLVFVYIWLPYMILPVNAALERVPKSLIEASGDLGAKPGYTFRRVILPLALPGVIAGSIFTFSLTLGDYIIPQIIGNSAPFIGRAVYLYQGTAGNIPLAAAMTVGPIVIMITYLLIARRLGAFNAL
jgi:putative spermidine/putrescine transport system permease protein